MSFEKRIERKNIFFVYSSENVEESVMQAVVNKVYQKFLLDNGGDEIDPNKKEIYDAVVRLDFFN